MKDPLFIAIPYDVYSDKDISHAAKLVYGRLKLYAGKDGRCCPKHETLALPLCLSDRQLRTILVELKNCGWIDWKRARTSCVYSVFPERKKTSYLKPEQPKSNPNESGRKQPVRSEENFHSDRKKTSDRKEVLKRSSEEIHAAKRITGELQKPQSASPAGEHAAQPKTKPETPKAENAAHPAAGVFWSAANRVAIREALRSYMNEEPPAGFEESCELRAHGATAVEVYELLNSKFKHRGKRYRRGHMHGPGGKDEETFASRWNWFLTVIGNAFSPGGEHIPEPTAKVNGELPRDAFIQMTSAIELPDEGMKW